MYVRVCMFACACMCVFVGGGGEREEFAISFSPYMLSLRD